MKKLFVIAVLVLCFAGVVGAEDTPECKALLKQKEIELLQVKLKAVRAEMAYMNERFPNCQKEEADLLRQLGEISKPDEKNGKTSKEGNR